MMKWIVVCGSVLMSGCSTTAAPNFINGAYYMAGDKTCKRVQAISTSRIMCIDEKGNQTGYREAMTDRDIQAYQMSVAQERASYNNLMQSFRETNQTFQNMQQQFTQQGQSFSAPQVQPISPYGYSGGVTYTQAGNSLIGSNGVTYRQVGSSIMGSDGTTCQIAGRNIICH
jgi:hypothetical protein